MKGFLAGMAAMVIISAVAAVVLNNLDYSSGTVNSSGSVRLGH